MLAMKIYILIVLMVFSISSAVHPSDYHKLQILKKLLKRKLSNTLRSEVLHFVTDSGESDKEESKNFEKIDKQEESDEIEESEKSEETKPGHTLLSPDGETLKSSAKYPKAEKNRNAVYGNLDSLGITKIAKKRGKKEESKESEDSEESGDSEKSKDSEESDDSEGSEDSEKIKPGKTLLSPDEGTLKSSAKYPKKSDNNAVYGNSDKLGITKIAKKKVKKEESVESEDSEESDDSEERKPGKTLLSPDEGTLQSSANYPKPSDKHAVYGNLDNLGITYDSVRQRLLNTGFRRHLNPLMTKLLDALQIINEIKERGSQALVFVKVYDADESDVEDLVSLEDSKTRRKYGSDSSDEANPNNPYTVHGDKYLQNWLWNFEMDGDHMNVNPRAPSFGNNGPSGAALFYGRKWWYYNQDDYQPLN